jgi:hypothetical protein
LHYYYNNDNLVFKGLIVPRPNEWWQIVVDLHEWNLPFWTRENIG